MGKNQIIRLWLRWGSIVVGFLTLIWLPIEDNHFTIATLLALAICFISAISITVKQEISSRKYIWVGLLGGFCVGPVGFMLMVFKIGLHNHTIPDFTIFQLFQFLLIAPVWALSGLLVGVAIYVYSIS